MHAFLCVNCLIDNDNPTVASDMAKGVDLAYLQTGISEKPTNTYRLLDQLSNVGGGGGGGK